MNERRDQTPGSPEVQKCCLSETRCSQQQDAREDASAGRKDADEGEKIAGKRGPDYRMAGNGNAIAPEMRANG